MGMRSRSWLAGLVFFFSLSEFAAAAPLAREAIPEPLKTWVPWVLHGAEEQLCPYVYNDAELHQCSWPSRIALNIGAKGGTFTQDVAAFRTLWMPLPGDAKHWPQGVKLDGKPAPVVPRDQLPGLVITAGTHSLSGSFDWQEMPENIPLPRSVGLVALSLNGAQVSAPNLDEEGRLWLKQQATSETGATRVDVRVHRLISDSIPFVITTHIELSASGKSQEIVLPNALLPGFIPLSLNSRLPARVEPLGKLRVQVRPGRWEITLAGRNQAQQKAITLPKSVDPLAASEEVWAFEAHNELRLVTLEGAPAIDPQQTTLPQEWKRFPAYSMQPGQTLKFVETKRGDPLPAPDQLRLQRNLWLDFDGRGYTVQDTIDGTISRAWRLQMAKPQMLGRAAVDGADQYITQTSANDDPGIELRQGRANISADSRLESGSGKFSATGWRQDFNHLSAQLHLPPGWELLHASGVDHAGGSWSERWTLLDFFLVLIITLACAKLFGWRWALVALAALVLSYHESGAPRWAWINMIAAIALLRVLPEGRARKSVNIYKWLSILALVFLLLPFAIGQIRQMIYPVLERPWQIVSGGPEITQATPAPAAVAPAAPAASIPEVTQEEEASSDKAEEPQMVRKDSPYRNKLESRTGSASSLSSKTQQFAQIDANAKVQTGPGLPSWRWNDYVLEWSGPVEQTQEMRLWLISPAMNVILTVARLALLILLFTRLAKVNLVLPSLKHIGLPMIAIICVALLGVPHQSAYAADMPTEEVLEQLKEKLLAPPQCLPNCAEISRLQLSASSGTLQLRLEAHADTDTALPLPGGANQWLAERVQVDGKSAAGLLRDKAGNLWLQLSRGVHQVTMESGTGQRDAIQIALPLRPRHIEAELDGWTLDGLGANGEAGESLLLSRVNKANQNATAIGDQLPPFVRVERNLNFGLTWQITTRVVREGPSAAPILVEVPLLAGEAVTTNEVRIQNGNAVVNLGPQSNEFSFESALKETPQLILKAPPHTNQIQVWRLNLSPQWHVVMTGIPVIHQQDSASQWLPEWRPWPGEEVNLALTKPAGVEGQTLTLDRSQLHITPGIRATDVSLTLGLRSSRGGQHVIQLPEGAVLQSVAINGATQAIRLDGRSLTLPIVPGKQEVLITWREPRGMTTLFSTSSVNVGVKGVNGTIHMLVPHDRWTLFLGGPRMGPAILFWGIVITLIGIAYGLGRIEITPLAWRHWFLLGLGLTQAPLITGAIVVGWFFALGLRKKFSDQYASNRHFNFGQIILVIWTLVALAGLFWAVQRGLLGYPEMQVAGNGSNSGNLFWYQDRTQATLPTAWTVSVPLLIYRLLMLAWALWLAYSLLKWLRWGWTAFSEGGIWRKLALWKAAGKPSSEESV